MAGLVDACFAKAAHFTQAIRDTEGFELVMDNVSKTIQPFSFVNRKVLH